MRRGRVEKTSALSSAYNFHLSRAEILDTALRSPEIGLMARDQQMERGGWGVGGYSCVDGSDRFLA
jgi:hypothetical protein